MNGHVREERLALYVRGDLAEADYRTVTRHVEGCPECGKTLADLSRSYDLLAESYEDPEPDALAEIRTAVLRQIRAQNRSTRRALWHFATAAVGAIAILLASLLLWRSQREELPPVARIPRPGPPPAVLPTPPVQAATIHITRAPRKRIEPGMRAATLVTEAGQPAILKMKTSDPNVVILWQLQENEKLETP